jgi:hypothetical protein
MLNQEQAERYSKAVGFFRSFGMARLLLGGTLGLIIFVGREGKSTRGDKLSGASMGELKLWLVIICLNFPT